MTLEALVKVILMQVRIYVGRNASSLKIDFSIKSTLVM